MKLKNLFVVAILATGSFTFANDCKSATNKVEGVEVETTVVSIIENQTPPEDKCSITLIVYKKYTIGNTTFVDEIEATGTGKDCAEAEADAWATINS